MNLKYLQTFLTVCEYKNFSRAAKQLGCAQSVVSTHIQQLEATLCVQLFERLGKTVALTAEGKALLPYAQQMLSLSLDIETLFHHKKRITLGISKELANHILGDILKEFTASCPHTEIYLKLLKSSDTLPFLLNGEIDLAFIFDLPVQTEQIQVLHKQEAAIVLCASYTHPLAGKTHISPQDFLQYPLLLPAKDCPYRTLFDCHLLSKGVRPKIALETDSTNLIKESSLCGIGVGLLPEFTIQKELIYHILEKLNYKTDYPLCIQTLLHRNKKISAELSQFLTIVGHHLQATS